MSTKDSQVLSQLKGVIDPDLHKDIVSLGFVKELTCDDQTGDVSFKLELTTPACPVKDQFETDCVKLIKELDWVGNVKVEMTARKPVSAVAAPGLEGVSTLIAVASCKGGVGKSTVAVNMAFAIAQTGAKVGIFDADIYGPSLPSLCAATNPEVVTTPEGLFIPFEHNGVKLQSFGFVKPKAPAVMRGPLVSRVVSQLLTCTKWGELDYLILDLPPGTGDIHLTLSQLVQINSAVMVTTPQKLSYIDVTKGIHMFNDMKIPTSTVVENMSYFRCDGCELKHRIFGPSSKYQLTEQFGIDNAFEVPMCGEVVSSSEGGPPVVLSHPQSEFANVFRDIAATVVRAISKIRFSTAPVPTVDIVDDSSLLDIRCGEEQFYMHARELRTRCRCAGCVNEVNGKQILETDSVPKDIKALTVTPMGNYAVAMTFDDGHSSSIFAYDLILKTARTIASKANCVVGNESLEW